MRSVIRVLSDSPIVEKITLDPEDNRIIIYYDNNKKNSDSIRELVGMVNFYFEKIFNASEAISLVNKSSVNEESTKKNYYLNSYSSYLCEFYRIDIQNYFENDANYFASSSEIIEIELMCLSYAKKFVISELGKQGSSKQCVIEFNYANIKDTAKRLRYIAALKELPKSILDNISVSLVRIDPNDGLEAINQVIKSLTPVIPFPSISVFFNNNMDYIDRLLNSQAKRVFVTVDYKKFESEVVAESVQSEILTHTLAENICLIPTNVDPKTPKVVGDKFNSLSFVGRQAINR